MHMRQEQRANRTGDKEMQFPEHTKVIEKLNEILNWMSSPTYCPTIDQVVMEYQADHPYKEPPPTAPSTVAKKSKKRRVAVHSVLNTID